MLAQLGSIAASHHERIDGSGYHRALGAAEYSAALASLTAWIEGGKRPTPAEVAARCREFLARFTGESCRIDSGYRPPPWESRVYPRAP